jgi:hypothetical protein
MLDLFLLIQHHNIQPLVVIGWSSTLCYSYIIATFFYKRNTKKHGKFVDFHSSNMDETSSTIVELLYN